MNRTIDSFLNSLPKEPIRWEIHSNIPGWHTETYLTEKRFEEVLKMWNRMAPDNKFWVNVIYEGDEDATN